MKRRKLIASLVALVLALSMLSTAVLADRYDIGEGNIRIEVDEDNVQKIKQGDGEFTPDENITIYGTANSDDDTIAIKLNAEGLSAEITLENVTIDLEQGSKSDYAISLDVWDPEGDQPYYGFDTVQINLVGDNTLDVGGYSIYMDTGNSGKFVLNGVDSPEGESATLTMGDATWGAWYADFNAGDTEDEADGEVTVQNLVVDGGGSAIRLYGDVDNGGSYTFNIDNSTITNIEDIFFDGSGDSEASSDVTMNITDSSVTTDGGQGITVANLTNNPDSTAVLNINHSSVNAKNGSCGIAAVRNTDPDSTGAEINLYNCVLRDTSSTIDELTLTYWGETSYGKGIVYKEGGDIPTDIYIDPTEPEPEPTEKKIGVIANEDGTFTVTGATLKQFSKIKVDGKTLSDADFTLTEENGALKLVFADAFLASLEAGAHTAEIIFGNGYALFTIVK